MPIKIIRVPPMEVAATTKPPIWSGPRKPLITHSNIPVTIAIEQAVPNIMINKL
jgi:hypothetical protein